MDRAIYWAWLQGVPEVGRSRFMQLLAQCGTPQDVYEIARRDSRQLSFLGAKARGNLHKAATEDELHKIEDSLGKYGIRAITYDDPAYPALLKQIYMPPSVLYARGRLPAYLQPERAIAIVGTRHETLTGKAAAMAFGRVLAQNGVTVVSGLALGIDASAHEGALESSAEIATVAVLANGLDKAYPVSNAGLFERVLERGFALSEALPGTAPLAGLFPLRNRIIAGLAHGTLVVEAGEKSGTFHTVNYALDAGREVFALPGRLTDEMSRGALELIKDGAKLVTDPYEIIAEYRDWPIKQRLGNAKAAKVAELNEEEKKIYALVKSGEKSADDIYEEVEMDMPSLLSLLTKLTQRGIIKRTPYMTFYI